MLTTEQLALAYELAVSPIRTHKITEILATHHQNLTPQERLQVRLAVVELRTPDDEFIVGDRVKFAHWDTGVVHTGTVTTAEWLNGELMVYIETDTDGGYATRGSRCVFAD